jgi:hypothetical protein
LKIDFSDLPESWHKSANITVVSSETDEKQNYVYIKYRISLCYIMRILTSHPHFSRQVAVIVHQLNNEKRKKYIKKTQFVAVKKVYVYVQFRKTISTS